MTQTNSSDCPVRIRQAEGPPAAVIRHRRAQPFFGRHPWVFVGAIEELLTEDGQLPTPGTVIRVISHERKFIAWGLFNPHSRIIIRLYSWQESDDITQPEFWNGRVASAVQLRQRLFDLAADGCGCRLVFSESDGLSGLTVDLYSGCLLVQFTSLALYQYREHLLNALQLHAHPQGIWLRTERGMREQEQLEAVDGLLRGTAPPQPLFIEYSGISFGVDVQQGQKTGYYLDQRENRLAASRYLQGAHILDAFCFSGGFGITAVKHGQAASSLGVDSSEPALTLAAANAELNGVAAQCKWICSDVQDALAEFRTQERLFDAVILDPPRMARTRGGLDRALQGYRRLNLAALEVLRPGGIFVTCSCSGLVSRQQFVEMIGDVARQSGRDIRILEHLGQPADHPVSATCPETDYLKVVICQVS